MYQAKDRGRNRIEHFEPATRASVVRLHHLGNELHRAIERDDFMLFYPAHRRAAQRHGWPASRRSCAGTIPSGA